MSGAALVRVAATLRNQRELPTWKLLMADRAPLIAALLNNLLLGADKALTASVMEERLTRDLQVLRAAGNDLPYEATGYLNEWLNSGWLSRRLPTGASEEEYTLTSDAASAVRFLMSSSQPRRSATESHLAIVISQLRSLADETDGDRQSRLASLLEQRARLDEEIARVNSGDVQVLPEDRALERAREILHLAEELVSDFRVVREEFYDLNRGLREQLMDFEGSRGALLEKVFAGVDLIGDSEAGKTFNAFWRLLNDPEQSAVLHEAIDAVSSRAFSRSLNTTERRQLRNLTSSLLDEGSEVHETQQTFARSLKSFVKSREFRENRRLHGLIRNGMKGALESKEKLRANAGIGYMLTRQDKEADERRIRDSREDMRAKLANLRVPKPCTQEIRDSLGQRVAKLDKAVSLESLSSIQLRLTQQFSNDRSRLQSESAELKADIEKMFAEYVRHWPAQAGGLDAKLDSAMDFFAKLESLETDDLPRVEENFFKLLQKQSTENLVALQHRLSDERKRIYDRLDQVNGTLRTAAYNPGTYLFIDPYDRIGEEVRAFREQLKEALSQAFSPDKELAERRFAVLSALVKRFSSQETADRNWKSLVLDVRLQVEFLVREFDSEGVEREVYNSGAGKSGGQRQKLAAACLAAALRYQLGGQDKSVPSYSTVVLDEAFDKADPQFTAAAMTIFNNFGFQTIIATPMRSVMTLEPFVGGAAVVHIADLKYSRFSLVQYDSERQGLAFSDRERALAQRGA